MTSRPVMVPCTPFLLCIDDAGLTLAFLLGAPGFSTRMSPSTAARCRIGCLNGFRFYMEPIGDSVAFIFEIKNHF